MGTSDCILHCLNDRWICFSIKQINILYQWENGGEVYFYVQMEIGEQSLLMSDSLSHTSRWILPTLKFINDQISVVNKVPHKNVWVFNSGGLYNGSLSWQCFHQKKNAFSVWEYIFISMLLHNHRAERLEMVFSLERLSTFDVTCRNLWKKSL